MEKTTEEFKFKKKFGQNFLSDKNLLAAIVSDAEIDKDDCVLEIGAGAGSLTQQLSLQAKKVLAFEIDRDLESTLKALNLKNVEFVFEDFLKYDTAQIAKKFGEGFKVVANLPYYVTTPILFRLLEEEKIKSITIMVQKEVAERVCAKVGGKDYGILTVMVNFFGDAKITRTISRQMFFPVPNVDSALLHIRVDRKFPEISQRNFEKFVRSCFAMRRKTLQNNLSKCFDKKLLQEKLDESVLMRRAETFSLDELVTIFKKLQK